MRPSKMPLASPLHLLSLRKMPVSLSVFDKVPTASSLFMSQQKCWRLREYSTLILKF